MGNEKITTQLELGGDQTINQGGNLRWKLATFYIKMHLFLDFNPDTSQMQEVSHSDVNRKNCVKQWRRKRDEEKVIAKEKERCRQR